VSKAGFTTPFQVLDVPGIRDFDMAHRRDALIAVVPAHDATPASVSAIVDWQTIVPAVQP
jgi:hypothetical protein